MPKEPVIIRESKDPTCQHMIEKISGDLIATCTNKKCGRLRDYKPCFTGRMKPPVSRKGENLVLSGEQMLEVERIILEVD